MTGQAEGIAARLAAGSSDVLFVLRYHAGIGPRPGYTCLMGTVAIAGLSAEERLRLLEELRESLSATPEAIPLTRAQREELDRRLDALDRDGPVGIPWEDVLRRIRARAR